MRVQELWAALNVEADERAAISAVYEPAEAGLVLRCVSLLVGPPSIADGWPAWRRREGSKPTPNEAAALVGPEFVVDLGQAVAGRAVVSLAEGLAWARAALDSGQCPSVGPLPGARASLARARAPIRVSTHSETRAGDLATWLARPIAGFHFGRTDEPAEIAAGESWTVDDQTLYTPAVDLLGISWFDSKTGPPPAGLLLGRFERRAWLTGQHLQVQDDLYEVHIGLEPERVEVADLELEVEERIGDELVLAERLRLEDTDLRQGEDMLYGGNRSNQLERPYVKLALPTLGRKVKRTVRLHHRDGMLLDEWQPFNLVESIGVTMTVNGARQPTNWIGDRRDAPELVELFGAVTRVRAQYAALRREGLPGRLFDDPAEGLKALRKLLERAPGELLVLDPWLRNWTLLSDLGGIPPRVLIGAGEANPPDEFPGRVARWRGTGDKAPFHDRFFLWEGGGVSVGTSAGATRNRLFRIARLGAIEATELRDRFARWWADPGFEHLQPGGPPKS